MLIFPKSAPHAFGCRDADVMAATANRSGLIAGVFFR